LSSSIPREERRSAFDRFAEGISRFVSRGPFFAVALAFVVVWLPTIFIFESLDTWQLVINTVTSVLAFLLIALLQNSERRYDDALHRKIDVLATALAELLDGDGSAEQRRRVVEDLRAATKLEERL
jgi:low affinity Fe/Cu permease